MAIQMEDEEFKRLLDAVYYDEFGSRGISALKDLDEKFETLTKVQIGAIMTHVILSERLCLLNLLLKKKPKLDYKYAVELTYKYGLRFTSQFYIISFYRSGMLDGMENDADILKKLLVDSVEGELYDMYLCIKDIPIVVKYEREKYDGDMYNKIRNGRIEKMPSGTWRAPVESHAILDYMNEKGFIHNDTKYVGKKETENVSSCDTK